jgi:peptidoglycan hydrolase CwlO-like protein
MARERLPVGIIIACVAGLIFAIGFFVNLSLGARKWRSSFNEEMAQRLDLEEKVARMEKERSALMADAKDSAARIEKLGADIEVLKSQIIQEREEKKQLQARLEQVQQPVLTSTAEAK